MKISTLLLVILSVLGLNAKADWVPVAKCDSGILEIDRDTDQDGTYQLVLRQPISEWLVNDVSVVASNRLNDKSELIVQRQYVHPDFGGYRSNYITPNGRNDGFVVALSLQNFPPRLDVQPYSPKYGSSSVIQHYNLHNCTGL